MTRRLLPLLLVALMLLAVPASASAVNVAVGIGDQRSTMFASPAWKALKLKKTRYFIPWNAASDRSELQKADVFMAAARANRTRVFMHVSTDNLDKRRGTLPSVKAYTRAVKKLVRRYKRLGVKEWGTWNEANHDTQPTYKSPKRAAQYYKAMRKFCKKCTIVGLDILDQVSKKEPRISYNRYMAAWFKEAGKAGRMMRVLGVHNYSEVNRRQKSKTRGIIKVLRRYNKRAKIWYTETGGLASFGRSFPCSESRQASRTSYMFKLAKQFDRHIARLYTYNWTGTDCSTRFDAGLVRLDGSTRPAYNVLRSRLKRYKR